MKKTFDFERQYNIYCDESGVENAPKHFVIGAIFIPRDQKKKISLDVETIKKKYKFSREIKWNKTTSLHLKFYRELIDYFISNADIEFKCIVVNKVHIDYRFHNGDKELMFYKFYYQLLRHKFKNDIQYYIFTDEKSRSFKPRFKELNKHLIKFSRKNNINVNIKHMQEYKSKDIPLLQLTDFFTGMVFFVNNYKNQNSVKSEISEYFSEKLGQKIDQGTNMLFEKFNVFKWVPKKKYGNY